MGTAGAVPYSIRELESCHLLAEYFTGILKIQPCSSGQEPGTNQISNGKKAARVLDFLRSLPPWELWILSRFFGMNLS